MSTASEREAALRRALLRAAEYIEPAPGGLERIQERLGRPRPLLVARLEAAWTVLLMRAPDVIEAIRRRAANMLRLVWDRFGPESEPGQGPSRLRWFCPLVAVSVAVFVIGAGVYIGLASPEALLFATNGASAGTPGAGSSQGAGPAGTGPGTPDGQGSRSFYPTTSSSPGSSQSCAPSLSPYKVGHPSSGPSIQSGSPTPTTGTSTSTSPSPTTSDGTSSSPSDSTPPPSGSSAGIPAAGLTSGNLALAGANSVSGSTTRTARHSAGSVSASQSAAPSPAQASTSMQSNNIQKYNPCQTKPKRKHKKKTTLTSTARLTSPQVTLMKLTQTQPGKAVAAKLD